jgi:ATP-dependent Clp protease ATP-binding subunit ClpA
MEELRPVVVLARDEALALKHDRVGTGHFLLGLIRSGKGVAASVLDSYGITLAAARQRVRQIAGPAQGPKPEAMTFTPLANKALENSLREAVRLGDGHVGTERMLLALVREPEDVAAQALVSLGADLGQLRHQVMLLRASKLGEALGAATGDTRSLRLKANAARLASGDMAMVSEVVSDL